MGVTAPPRPRPSASSEPLGAPGGRRPPGRFTDELFRWVALASGLLVLVILALIVYSTADKAWPWFQAEGLGDLRGQLGAGERPVRRRGDDLRTFLVGVIALVISVPISVGIALFVTEVAPRRRCGCRSCSWSTCSPRSRRSCSACGCSPCSRRAPRRHLREHLVGDERHPGARRPVRRPGPTGLSS